jgi:peptidoglycan hydrolase-like protein with peptidoglycan-binding domain
VQPLHAGWCWGYAFRPVRGGTTPSFHSAGLAIDLNAPSHPLGRRGTFKPDRARIIRALASRYGLRWGGDYRFRADEMHFEVILNRRGALDLAATIQHRAAPKAALAHAGAHRPDGDRAGAVLQQKRRIEYDEYRRGVALGSRSLSLGAAGDDVGFVQRWLGLHDDGYFGGRTEKRVRDYQGRRSIAVDGKVGRQTWTQMGIRT